MFLFFHLRSPKQYSVTVNIRTCWLTFNSNFWSLKVHSIFNVCFSIWQYEEYGSLSDSMLIHTIITLVYVTKFFWWEAGYWNTMDIAHDRGLYMLCICLSFFVPYLSSSVLCRFPISLPWTQDIMFSVSWCCFGSRFLHMLGLLGISSMYVHFSWHVPCQTSCKSWTSGTFDSPKNLPYVI